MAQLSHTIEKVLLCDPERNTSLVHIRAPESSPVEHRTLGQLFLVVEINAQLPINQELVGVIEEEMQKAYYQTAQLRVEPAFEQALQHVNEQLYQLIEGGVTEWLEHFNVVIGVVKDDQLLFTHLGQMNAVLIHRGRVTDIIANAGREKEKINPLKIFSTVVAGNITDGDHVLFYTPSVLDYLSQEKLRRIVLERAPADAIRQLEQLLDEASHHAAFGLLLLQASQKRETVHLQSTRPLTTRVESKTQSSMEHLIARERSTDRLLAPSFWLTLRQLGSMVGNGLRTLFRNTRSSASLSPRRRFSGITPPEHGSAVAQKSTLRSVANLSKRGGKVVGQSLQQTYAKRQKLVGQLKTVPSQISAWVNRFVRSFLSWSFTRKAIFLAIIMVLFFFAQSIVSIGRREANEEVVRQQQEAILAIEDKTFQAEAALSYDDLTRANALLDEAEQLLTGISDTETESMQNIRQEISQLRAQANRVVRIESPEQLVDLATLDGFGNIETLVNIGDQLYAPDSENGGIWSISAAGEAQKLNPEIDNLGSPILSSRQGTQSLVVYHDNDTLFSLTNGTFQQLNFTPPNAEKTYAAMATYQSRVYLLDTLNNQIFRALQGTTALGTSTSWLVDGSDVSQAVDLAVDGTIYVLDASGTVREFTQGRLQDFTLQDITPALTSAEHLWTDVAAENLYILDRSNKRLLVFTKAGRLVQQYASEVWEDLRAMSIDEAGNTAYLLNGSKVYKISLE